MTKSAKIFTNGRSQAVRLPADFRFDCKEVFIKKDPQTGEVILSAKPDNWDGFFKLQKACIIPEDFLTDRQDNQPQERNLFDD